MHRPNAAYLAEQGYEVDPGDRSRAGLEITMANGRERGVAGREADHREASDRASGGRPTIGRPRTERAVSEASREQTAKRPVTRETDRREVSE